MITRPFALAWKRVPWRALHAFSSANVGDVGEVTDFKTATGHAAIWSTLGACAGVHPQGVGDDVRVSNIRASEKRRLDGALHLAEREVEVTLGCPGNALIGVLQRLRAQRRTPHTYLTCPNDLGMISLARQFMATRRSG